jgi:hypothetical protein
LLALLRCDIQAIDQHWSLHRLAVSLPDGARDEALATSFAFSRATEAATAIEWPALEATHCRQLLSAALTQELAHELHVIRTRQENHLRRELDRIDRYFENYARELSERTGRTRNETTKLKAGQRLAAAQAEHQRRRADQVQRHEIRVLPHFDALLIIAEPAWRTHVVTTRHNQPHSASHLFIPRLRRWDAFNPAMAV